MATRKSGVIRSTKAPNLVIPGSEYNQRVHEQFTNQLRLYFTEIDNFTQSSSVPASGTTADRPVSSVQVPLTIGQFYFDTTLGYPIYWDGTQWVDAAGTPV